MGGLTKMTTIFQHSLLFQIKNRIPELRQMATLGCVITTLLLASTATFAQLGGLGGLGDKLKKKTPTLLAEKAPITPSLSDAKWGDASKDGFTPREPERSLMTLQRTPNGGFVLQPGHFS